VFFIQIVSGRELESRKDYIGITIFRERHGSVFDTVPGMADWKQNLITDARGIADMLRDTKTIAVLGIKP
jgi:hypothetical protein